MSVVMMTESPHGTQEIYDRIREIIGRERPAGGVLHVAGPGPNGGWRVIEVWDSEEEAQRFFEERCVPAFEAVGVPTPPQPQVWPVHNYIAEPEKQSTGDR